MTESVVSRQRVYNLGGGLWFGQCIGEGRLNYPDCRTRLLRVWRATKHRHLRHLWCLRLLLCIITSDLDLDGAIVYLLSLLLLALELRHGLLVYALLIHLDALWDRWFFRVGNAFLEVLLLDAPELWVLDSRVEGVGVSLGLGELLPWGEESIDCGGLMQLLFGG